MKLSGPFALSQSGVHPRKAAVGIHRSVPVAELAAELGTLLEQRLRPCEVVLVAGSEAENVEDVGSARRIPERAIELQRLPCHHPSGHVVTARDCHRRGTGERLGPNRRRRDTLFESGLETTPSFRQLTRCMPEWRRCPCQAQCKLGLTRRVEPVERDPEVVVLASRRSSQFVDVWLASRAGSASSASAR